MNAQYSVKKIAAIAVAISTLTLSACQTYDPYTGEQKSSKATIYGIGAALGCAILGSRKDGKRARQAAVGCGAIGAGIGAYMDAQETELRKEMEGTGVRVERNGDQLRLIMPGNITFQTAKYNISGNFYSTLDAVGRVLAKFQDSQLMVGGHADSTGSVAFNQRLSADRAQAVANYLRSNGVQSNLLMSRGYGSELPVADNSTPQGRQMNRRVELDIVPTQPR